MNNNGQVIFYALMVGAVIIVLAMALAPTIANFTGNARNDTTWDGSTGMNCSGETTSFTGIDGTVTTTNVSKAGCIVVDSMNWYFIGALIFIGGAFITAKIVFQ